MRTYKAYNLMTGEIVETSSRHALRKTVKHISKFDLDVYGIRARWVFSPKNIPC